MILGKSGAMWKFAFPEKALANSCISTLNTHFWVASLATGRRSGWATLVQEGGIVLGA